jgi:cytochrome c peroxidase
MKGFKHLIKLVLVCLVISLYYAGSVHSSGQQEELARALRQAIIARVGSLAALRVPATNAALPQPTLADGVTVDPRFAITEAKRYLGKQLYFDPVRANRIRPEFGGIPEIAQTASCGSCHLGEAAGKAGQVINLALGAEGRGYTDENGVFHVRRRIQPGLVDTIPTPSQFAVNGVVVADGRFDAVDAVPRLSPSMVGFGFNTRLLLGGKAGEPASSGFNPRNLPAGENLAEIAFDAHRMLETQKDALQKSPVYIKLFQDAFPEEAARFDRSRNLDDLINDDTIERAVAAFLRTVVTRNTAWDRFLAGDDRALTERQLRGALLFVQDTAQGGANCLSCHSGPMLNKQLGDEAGRLVEENFYNLGIGDHPLQGLNRIALHNPNHHDIGRAEITGRSQDLFKFRVLTLRQLRDGGQFTHSAMFNSVREVVEYFNAGVPADPVAVAAGNVTPRFTHPRGPDQPQGLGLTRPDIDALVDFLENALYDPAFVQFDPRSSTDTFELNQRDLTYSVYRPDLAALGAVDGLMASGLAASNDDGLTRRDRGLEFLDVTSRVMVSRRSVSGGGPVQIHRLVLTNISSELVDTHLIMAFVSLTPGVEVMDAEGFTAQRPVSGVPYVRLFLPGGVLAPGASLEVPIRFSAPAGTAVQFNLALLCGQGRP